jgi:hypothetical protein
LIWPKGRLEIRALYEGRPSLLPPPPLSHSLSLSPPPRRTHALSAKCCNFASPRRTDELFSIFTRHTSGYNFSPVPDAPTMDDLTGGRFKERLEIETPGPPLPSALRFYILCIFLKFFSLFYLLACTSLLLPLFLPYFSGCF